MRRITHVAIKTAQAVHSLPEPNRHHHVIRAMGGSGGPDVQGFLDDAGQFLNRRDALQVALQAGQVKNPDDIRGGQLYSEDLW